MTCTYSLAWHFKLVPLIFSLFDFLKLALDAIRDNQFSPESPTLFSDLYAALMEGGDRYFLLADYRPYVNAQAKVSALYRHRRLWARQAILNVARMGRFSSDRAIREYARDIWHIKPLSIRLDGAEQAP